MRELSSWGPLIIFPEAVGQTGSLFLVRSSNESILVERYSHYSRIWSDFQVKVAKLKEEYGSWPAIPDKVRTSLANSLRYSGFIYEQGSGWTPPNSNSLSSL